MENQQSAAPWEEGGKPAPEPAPQGNSEESAQAYEEIFKLALNGAQDLEMRQTALNMGVSPQEADALIGKAKTEAQAILGNSGPAMHQPADTGFHQEYQTDQGGGSGGQIIIGLLLIVGGIAATAIDYSMTDAGGSYRIWWGASIYGVYVLIKAVAGSDR